MWLDYHLGDKKTVNGLTYDALPGYGLVNTSDLVDMNVPGANRADIYLPVIFT